RLIWPLDRIADAGRAPEHAQVEVAFAHDLRQRRRLDVELVITRDRPLELRARGVRLVEREGLAPLRQVEHVGVADVVPIPGRSRIAAPEPGLDEAAAVADVLHLVEGRLPGHSEGLVARASAVPAWPRGVRLDSLAE